MRGKKKILVAALGVCVFAFASVAAMAVNTYWACEPATPGSWHEAANWNNGVPVGGDCAYLDNGGTALISADAGTSLFYLGNYASGAVEQTGGAAVVTGYFYYGHEPTGSGAYELIGGTLSVGTVEYLGYSGYGAFVQIGGTHTVNNLAAGMVPGAYGSYDLSAGNLYAGYETLGYYGAADFVQTGGLHRLNYTLVMAAYDGASTAYDLSAGDLVVGTYETVGYYGTAVFTQTGGTHDVGIYMTIGVAEGSDSAYNLYGGSLEMGDLYIDYGWMDIDLDAIDYFRVDGDKTSALDGYIAAGKIFDSSSAAEIYAVYDAQNDWTTLAAGESTVPEPATMALCGVALAGLAGTARRRMRKQA